jgi:hypothetical protein
LPNYIEFTRGQKGQKSNSLKGKQLWAKSGIELGENGRIKGALSVAASQTTAAVGGLRSYLESVTIVPATTASGAVTIFDGSTAIVTVPAAAALGQSAPYCVQLGIRATNASTGFKITTGASVSVIAVGKFSS